MTTEDETILRKKLAVDLFENSQTEDVLGFNDFLKTKSKEEGGAAMFVLSSIEHNNRISNHVVWANKPWHDVCGLEDGICCEGGVSHGADIKALLGGKTEGLTSGRLKNMQATSEFEGAESLASSQLMPLVSNMDMLENNLFNQTSRDVVRFDITKYGLDFGVDVRSVGILKNKKNESHISVNAATVGTEAMKKNEDALARKQMALDLYKNATNADASPFPLAPDKFFSSEKDNTALFVLSSVDLNNRISNHVVWANSLWHDVCGLEDGVCCEDGHAHGADIKALLGGRTQGVTANRLMNMQKLTSSKPGGLSISRESTAADLQSLVANVDDLKSNLFDTTRDVVQFDIMKRGMDFAVDVQSVAVLKTTNDGAHVSVNRATSGYSAE